MVGFPVRSGDRAFFGSHLFVEKPCMAWRRCVCWATAQLGSISVDLWSAPRGHTAILPQISNSLRPYTYLSKVMATMIDTQQARWDAYPHPLAMTPPLPQFAFRRISYLLIQTRLSRLCLSPSVDSSLPCFYHT